MSESPDAESINSQRRVDELSDEYKQQIKAGESPKIEDHLSNVEQAERETLLLALVEVELELSGADSNPSNLKQYLKRFPDHHAALASLFERNDSTLYPSVHGDDESEQTVIGVAAEPESSESGTKIRYFGEYELLEEIARGGMGVVFKARQVKLNRIVALKMILSGELAGDEEVQRFKTEAEAAANLDHPGIVPIFEIGEHNGQHYFSMGYVEGHSLADRVKDGPLPPREAAEIVKKVAEAVAYAHGKGVIHRDLKPANVLLDQDGAPKVTDFGLAKQVGGDSGLTQTGVIVGTPSYMSPEQAAGETSEVGPSSDVYSIGATLYRLLSGRPPFQCSNVLDTLKQVIEREPVSPRLLNPEVDEDLETICIRCLEKGRDKRLPNAQFLIDELKRYLNGFPIVSRQPRFSERLQKWCLRNRAEAVLIVAVLLLVALGASIFATTGLPTFQRVLGANVVNKGLFVLCVFGPLMSVVRRLGAEPVRMFEVLVLRVWKNCIFSIYAAVSGFTVFVGLMWIYLMIKATTDFNEDNVAFILIYFLSSLLVATWIQRKYALSPGTRVTWALFCSATILGILSIWVELFAYLSVATLILVMFAVGVANTYGFARMMYYPAHKYAVATKKVFGWVPWPFSLADGNFRVSRMLFLTNLFPFAILIGIAQLVFSFALLVVVLPVLAVEQVRLVLFPESPTVSESVGYLISLGAFATLLWSLVV